MLDKTLTCVDCGNEFNFSVEEQQFFNQLGFQEPERCNDCHDKRKRDEINKFKAD